jgi:hypothetical protein
VAISILLEVLRTPSEEEHWTNAVFTLGIIGDESITAELVSLVEGNRQATAAIKTADGSPHGLEARRTVPTALGYIANRYSNDMIVRYLRDGASTDTWRIRLGSRGLDPRTASQFRQQLARQCLWGLAYSGSQEAGEILDNFRVLIQDRDAASRQLSISHEFISDVIATFREVRAEGLDQYYKRRTF